MSAAHNMGGCLLFYFLNRIVLERGAADMTAFERLTLLIAIINLTIASVALLLKLFVLLVRFLDDRYKKE